MAEVKPLFKPKNPVRRQSSGRGLVRVSPGAADAIDDPTLIESWDDEELKRGRRRDKRGTFSGRDPIVVPTNCYREMVRRSLRSASVKMTEHVEEAVEALTDIIRSTQAEDRDRIAAAKIIMERVMGKVPDKIELGGKTPLFLGILQGGIVPGSLALEDPSIVDVESVEIEWDSNG